MNTTIEMFGNIFCQVVFCTKQPNSDYIAGLCWEVQGEDWNSYSPGELPETLDNGLDKRRFPAKEWRKAQKYANQLCKKYNLKRSTS